MMIDVLDGFIGVLLFIFFFYGVILVMGSCDKVKQQNYSEGGISWIGWWYFELRFKRKVLNILDFVRMSIWFK